MNRTVPPLTLTLPMLIKKAGLNETSLVAAINDKAGKEVISQSKIWNIRKGISKEPRDSSLAPIADYFGLRVDQLKDVDYIKSLTGNAPPDSAVEAPKGTDMLSELLSLMSPASKVALLRGLLPDLAPSDRAVLLRDIAELQVNDIQK